MSELHLHSMLNYFGLDPKDNVKLYRHVDHYFAKNEFAVVQDVYERGDMPAFQAAQGSANLGNGLVGFFIAEQKLASRFIGMYKIRGQENWMFKSSMAQKARDLNFLKKGNVWYDLIEVELFKPLVDRIIVNWPLGRSAHRWLRHNGVVRTDLEILEIRPRGYYKSFPGFDKLVLNHNNLVQITNGEAASNWLEALRSTRGVYLITDMSNGSLYVGSATGQDGLLGRWFAYAKSGHGGNKLIRLGLENKTLHAENFQISVLETLSNLASNADGLEAERRWKRKLGNKATNLNGN